MLFPAEKRCGFSHEAHDLKVAGSNPASVKGLLRTGARVKRDSISTVYHALTGIIGYFWQRRDAVFLMRESETTQISVNKKKVALCIRKNNV